MRNIAPSDVLECVKYVAISHASKYRFERLPKHQIHPQIRLPLICALFRLIDGCDLSPARANSVLYEILMAFDPLNDESKDVWNAHFAIAAVVFNNHRVVVSSRDRLLSSRLTDHLQQDLEHINEILQSYHFPSFSVNVRNV